MDVYLPKVVRLPQSIGFPDAVQFLESLCFLELRSFPRDLVKQQPLFSCLVWPTHLLLLMHLLATIIFLTPCTFNYEISLTIVTITSQGLCFSIAFMPSQGMCNQWPLNHFHYLLQHGHLYFNYLLLLCVSTIYCCKFPRTIMTSSMEATFFFLKWTWFPNRKDNKNKNNNRSRPNGFVR